LFQRARVHARARLVLARLQRDGRQRLQLALVGLFFLVGREQRIESAAEALESGFVHVGSGIQKVFARSIISCAKAMQAWARMADLSNTTPGMPWLGASARRTLRGTIARNTLSPKCPSSWAETCCCRVMRGSNITRSRPMSLRPRLRLACTFLMVFTKSDSPSSA